MNEADSDDDLPIIDVRSPAERIAESGRDGFERLRDRAASAPLSLLASMWMVALTAIIATDAYSVFNLGSGTGAFGEIWAKFVLLAQENSFGVAVAALAGLALAALSARAVVASALGLLIGAWVVFAGGCGVAAAAHGYGYPLSLVGTNRFVLAVASLGGIAMGVVIVALAWTVLVRPAAELG